MSSLRQVFSIATGAPFLPILCEKLLAGALFPDYHAALPPHTLARLKLYLPTRRACRAFRETFTLTHQRMSGCALTLLPTIIPLGALDETAENEAVAPPQNQQPKLIPEGERLLALTNLILAFGKIYRTAQGQENDTGNPPISLQNGLAITSPGQAYALAGELAALIDEMRREGVAPDALQSLDLEGFDRHWQFTRDFLGIATAYWPRQLAEWGALEASRALELHLEREISQLQALPRRERQDKAHDDKAHEDKAHGESAHGDGLAASAPQWVLAAGSTGSTILTARLLNAISLAPRGAVVLPGLDNALEDEAFASLLAEDGDEGAPVRKSHVTHPQFTLANLLRFFAMERADVTIFDAAPAALRTRRALLSMAMRPVDHTQIWHAERQTRTDNDLHDAFADVSIIAARDEEEEALALAVAMRAPLADTSSAKHTVALVTPERTLAARVRLALTRWGLDVEDSAGQPLAHSVSGTHMRLILAYARSWDAADALALLHHPASRFGVSKAQIRTIAAATEWLLRAQECPLDLGCLVKLEAGTFALHPEHEGLRADVVKTLRRLLEECAAFAAPARQSFAAWLAALKALCEVMARTGETEGNAGSAERLAYPKTEAPELANFFALGASASAQSLLLNLDEFAALSETCLASSLVPMRAPGHPRLKILGLLEARLLECDVILLGGLNETVWPGAAQGDPFLSRPMREALGLALPERRIGQSAHDFVAACGHPRVVMSYAHKRAGTPAIPSRFLLRLKACLGEEAYGAMERRGARYLALARALDAPRAAIRIARPAPKPAEALRPKQLSVTRIEVLRRDPYALYAEKILKLNPLGGLATEMTTKVKGTLWHAFFEQAAHRLILPALKDKSRAGNLAKDAELLATQIFQDALVDPKFALLQWREILRALRFYCAHESALVHGEPKLEALVVETSGKLALALADGSDFTLTAKADRIEMFADGSLHVADYKTGALPKTRDITTGFSPQLTLEVAMLRAGAFGFGANKSNGTPSIRASYIKIGGRDGGSVKPVKDAEVLAALHLKNCLALLSRYGDADVPYRARPFVEQALRYNAFAHLARTKEWSDTGGHAPAVSPEPEPEENAGDEP